MERNDDRARIAHTGFWTREDVDRVSRDALVVVPTGSTEQHGWHLPTLTDTLLAEALAVQLVERLPSPGALVVPPVSLGYSPHHFPYAGTLSLSSSTFARVLRDIGGSLHRYGFRSLVFLNGHGGNDELVKISARDLVHELGMTVAALSYWTPAGGRLAEIRDHAGGDYPIPGHAGAFETALMMHFYPDQVRWDRLPDTAGKPPHRSAPYWVRPGSFATFDGFTDDPRQASAALGAAFAAGVVEELAAVLAPGRMEVP